jgi:branched-chain amino acid aminotransferase
MMQITVKKSQTLKPKPDETNLGFGTIFTDHMFNMDYSVEKGWHNPRIEPYACHSHGPLHHGAALRPGGVRRAESLPLRMRAAYSSSDPWIISSA